VQCGRVSHVIERSAWTITQREIHRYHNKCSFLHAAAAVLPLTCFRNCEMGVMRNGVEKRSDARRRFRRQLHVTYVSVALLGISCLPRSNPPPPPPSLY
jgi:hypothetical protein